MRDLFKVATFLIGAALLAAAGAPWLFWLGQWGAERFRLLAVLGETDFQRYFNRSFLLAALLLLLPLWRWLRVESIKELGLERNTTPLRHVLAGFSLMVAAIWAYGGLLIVLGFASFKEILPLHRLPSAIWTAVAVSCIEEVFFRGALLGLFRRTSGKWIALAAVSALYSILHFLKPAEGLIAHADVRWWSGFALIPHAFRQFGEPLLLLSGFTTLFLLGWIFGLAVYRTRSLWLPIGLHAGAILAARFFNILTEREEARLPWIGENLLTGIGPLFVLGVVLFVVATSSWARGHETPNRENQTPSA
ncbi:MAG: CPBP family intramembrane glutamic endopeptidase [Verrucomicrobiia bacterium]